MNSTKTSLLDEITAIEIRCGKLRNKIEKDEVDHFTAMLFLLSNPNQTPIDPFENNEKNIEVAKERLGASQIKDSYFINMEKTIRALANNTNLYVDDTSATPFTIINSVSKIQIFNDAALTKILTQHNIPTSHLPEFLQSIKLASGYFFIADSLTIQKYSIVDKRSELKTIGKSAATLKTSVIEIQKILFGFSAGAVVDGETAIVEQLINSFRLIKGLEKIETIYADLIQAEAISWVLNDQKPSKRAKLPIKVFIFQILSFLVKTHGRNFKINVEVISFCSACLRELGLLYEAETVKFHAKNVFKQVPTIVSESNRKK